MVMVRILQSETLSPKPSTLVSRLKGLGVAFG